ncbi:hypothetical protein [Nitrolancea hollandica]|uniref:Uncharacterized protein n=1 Tax=Nitrolancea hollandica Lb TaxID=1129897 RepID=I4EK58_9BACT|nr:hypothetical protein [Nitrolancea hollandica]CCF85070.1 hypothetical protein NITHO_4420008 [Nitrolancea hollandica Lb]
MGIHELIAALLWGFLIASLILTAIGLWRRSWKFLWLAAGLSLVFSIAAGFSIGPLTFLLTCLQLAAAIASRRESGTQGWVLLLLAAFSSGSFSYRCRSPGCNGCPGCLPSPLSSLSRRSRPHCQAVPAKPRVNPRLNPGFSLVVLGLMMAYSEGSMLSIPSRARSPIVPRRPSRL